MKSNIFYTIIVCILIHSNYSAGQNYFLKDYEDAVPTDPYTAYHIRETNNKEFIFESTIRRISTYYGLFTKIDSIGNVTVYKKYSPVQGNSQKNVFFSGIETTSDSTYLIFGRYQIPSGSNYRTILLKLNPDGSIVWCKESPNNIGSYPKEIYKTSSNQFILRSDDSYITLLKVDKDAIVYYSKFISDSAGSSINVNKANITQDDGLILGGRCASSGSILIRTDSLFNPIFSIRFPDHYSINNVISTIDGGFISLLEDASFSSTFSILKTDSIGNVIWAKQFSDSTKIFFPELLFENSDQTFYCIVNWLKTNPQLFNYKSAIIKLDNAGNVLDIKDSLDVQYYEDIIRTSNGKYCSLFAKGPNSSYNPAVMMNDSLFSQSFGLGFGVNCIFGKPSSINYNSTSTTLSFNFPITLVSNNFLSFQNINFYDSTFSVNTSTCPLLSVDEISAISSFDLYPIPCTNKITIELKVENPKTALFIIRNILGQIVYLESEINLHNIFKRTYDVNSLSGGIYLFEININSERKVKKFVKE